MSKLTKPSRSGSSSIMAVLFMSVFSVLAVSFTTTSNLNVQMSASHHDLSSAQAAAESGLEYAHYVVNNFRFKVAAADRTSSDYYDAERVFSAFIPYAQESFESSPRLEGTLTSFSTFTEGGLSGIEVCIPPMKFSNDPEARFRLSFRQYTHDLDNLLITSTGTKGQATSHVQLSYAMRIDGHLLNFAIASRSPIEITDNSTIGVGVYSDWEETSIAPPISLADISTIEGDINTTLPEALFPHDQITGTYANINYNQPQLELPTADDFDTSMYAKETTVLSSGHTSNLKEYYPHAPGDYTQPVIGSVELNRTVYENRIISDKRAIAGNALFRNCLFQGIFYIGTTSGIGTNNVRFENCTFNGPVITGVPPKFGPEDWKKNVLYFTGDTVFNNTAIEETTILAPNYNVDIGDTTAESTITGIVLGGVVDVRGDATIDGTIVSMADPLELGDEAGMLQTNIGISEIGEHTIRIFPSPDRMLPMGMAVYVIIVPDGNTYKEF